MIPRALIPIAIALMTPARTVVADDAAPDPQGKKRFDDGVHAYNVQQYREAADQFRAAYLLDPRPEYLFSLGQAQRLSGDCTSAVHSYEAFLRTRPTAERAKFAEAGLELCRTPNAAPLPVHPAPREPERHLARNALLVGGGLTAIAGVGTWWYGRHEVAAANEATTYGDVLAHHGGETYEALGVALVAIGAAALVGAGLVEVMGSRTTSVAIWPTRDGGGAAVGLRF